MVEMKESPSINLYKETAMRMLGTNFPGLTKADINAALDYSIQKRYKEEPCVINNSYNKKKVNMNLQALTDYIISREPVLTCYGCMWKRKGTIENPLGLMIKKFMDQRGIYKKEMFRHPKGSEDFEKYNLLQLLAKLDANALYGTLGMYSSLYYNVFVASSITTQGRSLVSSMGMCFESFLSNNVKFGSLNEVITFIDNIVCEKKNRKLKDKIILDRDIPLEECFCKVVYTIGFEWIPDNDDLNIIYDYLAKLNQEDINRIYYKNNLYEFLENSKITKMLISLLDNLDAPFMNPNKPPKSIEAELDVFADILFEYVYYGHMIIDRQWRMDNMIKNVTAISDTDSTIISLDAFYRFTLDKVRGRDFKLLRSIPLVDIMEADEFGEIHVPLVEEEPLILDFDFYEDEVIERERQINLTTLIPQDGLRYSIINILAYVLDKVVNDYMIQFCKNANSYDGNCLIIAKNEFLFKRALLTMAKKNYATIQELQEGNIVDFNHRLDLKGLAIDKSTMNDKTRKQLKALLLDEILDTVDINQVDVLKKIAVLEKGIYQSLHDKSKEYYKPVTVKPMTSYENPMRIQGIKASVVWNHVKGQYDETINLEERNALDIVKVNINNTNTDKIKDSFPETYCKLVDIVGTKTAPASNSHFAESYKGAITAIAVPKDAPIPDWMLEFIDYSTIINDNLCNFPLESIGVQRLGKNTVNYSNLVKL